MLIFIGTETWGLGLKTWYQRLGLGSVPKVLPIWLTKSILRLVDFFSTLFLKVTYRALTFFTVVAQLDQFFFTELSTASSFLASHW